MVDQNRLYAKPDAKVWADEFMAEFGDRREDIDEGLMIGWFANAMEQAVIHRQADAPPLSDIVEAPLLEHLESCDSGFCRDFNALMTAYQRLAGQ